MLLSVDGNAPKSLEDGSKRPEEPFFLHEEMALDTVGATIEKPDDEIPVAGMRSQTDDVFVGMFFGNLGRPSHSFIQQVVANFPPHLQRIDLVNDFTHLSSELLTQVLKIITRCHAWFWMRHAADEVALHQDDGMKQGIGVVLMVLSTIKRSCYTLGEQFLTDGINSLFQ